MKYLTFDGLDHNSYEVCILSPVINKTALESAYMGKFSNELHKFIAFELYSVGKKTPVKVQKEFLNELIPELQSLKVKYLLVCDGDYFKTLAKQSKAEPNLGYVFDCVVDPNIKVIYCPNFRAIFHNPEKVKEKIDLALTTLQDHRDNTYVPPGSDIIKFAAYPKTVDEIKYWLRRLYEEDRPLTSDIEGFSLKHYSCGIGSISFAWSHNEGIAFPVDLLFGDKDSKIIRGYLRDFFKAFRQKIIWHNISFDVYVLIYQLFMKDIIDTEGLLTGIDIMLDKWECTKLISYLATNSCAGNELGLKAQAQEFAGNYAQEDIKDITKIPLDDLLEYNLVDSLSTWFAYDKHYQTMIDDDQLDIYENLFKPAIKDIIQMQLTGMPLDMEEVQKANDQLTAESIDAMDRILNNQAVIDFSIEAVNEIVAKKNASYKVKRITATDVNYMFNPNSSDQLQAILYGEDFLDLPVLEYTKNGNPATDGDTLEKLLNHTTVQSHKDLIQALLDHSAVAKILSSFLPVMLAAPQGPDGWHYLFGNFNLGGTVSGRLSSNNPNLQNLPAKSKYSKIIKKCFKAPKGWIFVGLDFASLEDKISALWTKDPNKIKVYTSGFDGHALRAAAYFRDEMPEITQKLAKKDLKGKFYKVTTEKGIEYYHESDLPEEVKRNLKL